MWSRWKNVLTWDDLDTDWLENILSMPFLLFSWLIDEAFQDQFQGHSKHRIDIEQKLLLKYLDIAP